MRPSGDGQVTTTDAPTAQLYRRLGVRRVINAADTYTLFGGGPLPDEVRAAMDEAARHHVDIPELLTASGQHLARLTHNEGALVVNGAAAGIACAIAACIGGGSPIAVDAAPRHRTSRTEVVLFCCQRNPYDRAVAQAGGQIVEVGYADGTPLWQLEAALGEDTAAVVWFAGTQFERHAPTLEDTVALAHAAGVPVIVDAAAQLPPVENLWDYTGRGADLAIFSGGKGLRGPQATGLVLGRADLVEACAAHTYPYHSLGRTMKTCKENIAGLVAAVERAVALDWTAAYRRWDAMVEHALTTLGELPHVQTWREPEGRLGQTYPRAFLRWNRGPSAQALIDALADQDPSIRIGYDHPTGRSAYLNPFTLEDGEVELVVDAVHRQLAERAELAGNG